MTQKSFHTYLAVGLLLVFSSCAKHYDFMPDDVPQGKRGESFDDITAHNLRTIKVHDEFMLEAQFDALWLSPDVRQSYATLHMRRHGKNEAQRDAMLRRHLEEDRHWATFYVLAEVFAHDHEALSDSHPMWALYLETVNGEKIEPLSIKEVELDPEVQHLFSYRNSRYKTAYEVRFPAHDHHGEYYLGEGRPFRLVASSTHFSGEAAWGYGPKRTNRDVTLDYVKTNKKGRFVPDYRLTRDEDFYWS